MSGNTLMTMLSNNVKQQCLFWRGILKWHDAQDTDYYTASQTSINVINVKVKAIFIFIFIYIPFSHTRTTMILLILSVIYQCPRQRGAVECGYYVCKYMLDIVYQDQIKQGRKFQKVCTLLTYISKKIVISNCKWYFPCLF